MNVETLLEVLDFMESVLRNMAQLPFGGILPICLIVFSIGAIIDERILALHGGLSPHISTIGQIRVFDRFHEVPDKGAFVDLLWSNPETTKEGYHSNNGPGCMFGKDIINKFLKQNGLNHIVRGHQLCVDGYQNLFGLLTTVWSAPNFLHKCNNVGSILELNESANLDMFHNTFSESPDSERRKPPQKKQKNLYPDYYV